MDTIKGRGKRAKRPLFSREEIEQIKRHNYKQLTKQQLYVLLGIKRSARDSCRQYLKEKANAKPRF